MVLPNRFRRRYFNLLASASNPTPTQDCIVFIALLLFFIVSDL